MKKGVEGQVSVVYVTVPAPGADDVAKTLASSIIENKLAACVNIVPGLHDLYCICLYSNSRRHKGSHMSASQYFLNLANNKQVLSAVPLQV